MSGARQLPPESLKAYCNYWYPGGAVSKLTSGLHDTTSSFFVLKFLTWPFLVTFLLDGENVTLSSRLSELRLGYHQKVTDGRSWEIFFSRFGSSVNFPCCASSLPSACMCGEGDKLGVWYVRVLLGNVSLKSPFPEAMFFHKRFQSISGISIWFISLPYFHEAIHCRCSLRKTWRSDSLSETPVRCLRTPESIFLVNLKG